MPDETAEAGGAEDRLDSALRTARHLVQEAEREGIPLRILGGVAVHALCSPRPSVGGTAGRDIDLVTTRRHRRTVARLLEREGFLADRHYNALNGHRQLYFINPERDRPVDVIIDRLVMCHALDLSGRLESSYPTIPLADLVLSKLQVVQLNLKDLLDTIALLRRYPLQETDDGGISLPRFSELTSNDWGWWRTVTGNLTKVSAFVEEKPDTVAAIGGPFDVSAQVDRLLDTANTAPKAPRWKLRALIGERMRWYEVPEEVAHE